MLKKLKINGFRKFEDITLDDFKQVNLIAGSNNSGKTTILEGIFSWACGLNIYPIVTVISSRERYSFMVQSPYWLSEEILTLANNKDESPLIIFFLKIMQKMRHINLIIQFT